MTITTVAELIRELETFDPEQPVRIAFQPSYPLAARVANVTEIDPAELDSEDGPMGVRADGEPEGDRFVWIAASDSVPHSENPYAPRAAWSEW